MTQGADLARDSLVSRSGSIGSVYRRAGSLRNARLARKAVPTLEFFTCRGTRAERSSGARPVEPQASSLMANPDLPGFGGIIWLLVPGQVWTRSLDLSPGRRVRRTVGSGAA